MATLDLKQSSTTRMTTRREYDLLNRLRRVESLSTATNTLGLVFDYQYNQANQRRRIDNGDGTHWAIEYDDLGQVVGGKKYWPDGSAVPGQQFEYDFDDIGNRVAHRYGGDATGQSSKLREVSYTANSLNQYTAKANVSVVDLLGLATEGSVVTLGGSTNGVYRRGEYFHRAVTNTANTWPSLTNVVSKSGTSVTNIGSLFIPPTPEAFTHDADGNLTQDGRWDYTWDAENRLIQMESKSGFPAGSKRKLEFEYDWQGRRIKKVSHSAWNGSSYATVVTTKFIYDAWNLLAELDSSNNVIRSYVWGTDLSGTMQGAGGVGGLLFVKESDGTPHFAAYDGNGNVMGLVKGTDGTRTATYEYDPFGQPLRATGSMAVANPMRFSTKFTDSETGLLYYGYRYYSPSSGRWPNRDSLQESGGVNLFAMTANNSVNQFDYLGLVEWIRSDGLGVHVARVDFKWIPEWGPFGEFSDCQGDGLTFKLGKLKYKMEILIRPDLYGKQGSVETGVNKLTLKQHENIHVEHYLEYVKNLKSDMKIIEGYKCMRCECKDAAERFYNEVINYQRLTMELQQNEFDCKDYVAGDEKNKVCQKAAEQRVRHLEDKRIYYRAKLTMQLRCPSVSGKPCEQGVQ